jgi:hypothetical protein
VSKGGGIVSISILASAGFLFVETEVSVLSLEQEAINSNAVANDMSLRNFMIVVLVECKIRDDSQLEFKL